MERERIEKLIYPNYTNQLVPKLGLEPRFSGSSIWFAPWLLEKTWEKVEEKHFVAEAEPLEP